MEAKSTKAQPLSIAVAEARIAVTLFIRRRREELLRLQQLQQARTPGVLACQEEILGDLAMPVA